MMENIGIEGDIGTQEITPRRQCEDTKPEDETTNTLTN